MRSGWRARRRFSDVQYWISQATALDIVEDPEPAKEPPHRYRIGRSSGPAEAGPQPPHGNFPLRGLKRAHSWDPRRRRGPARAPRSSPRGCKALHRMRVLDAPLRSNLRHELFRLGPSLHGDAGRHDASQSNARGACSRRRPVEHEHAITRNKQVVGARVEMQQRLARGRVRRERLERSQAREIRHAPRIQTLLAALERDRAIR